MTATYGDRILADYVDPRSVVRSTWVDFADLAMVGTAVPVATAPRRYAPRFSVTSALADTWALINNAIDGVGASVAPIEVEASTVRTLEQLREQTSFTWSQISTLLGVSRRTVHLWAAGGNISAAHEERLMQAMLEVEGVRSLSLPNERSELFSLLNESRKKFASAEADVNKPADTYAMAVS